MKARIKRKRIKKSILVMDTNSIPEHIHVHEWFRIFKEQGLVLWDSMQRGEAPKIYPIKNKVLFKIQDHASR